MMEATKPSEAVQAKVDAEVQKIIGVAMKNAESMLKKFRKEMDRVADKLLEVETLEGEEFEKIVGVPKVRVKDSDLS